MKLKIAQVVGLNSDQKAAQVISAVRETDNAFFAVLELICDDAFTKGRQALSELEDFYFEFEGTVAEKLKATFTEVEKKFPGEIDFNICLATVAGKALYLIGKGEMGVYLKRADKLSPLLSADASSQLISGFLQDGDRVLLSTNSLANFLGDELSKSLSLPIETFEEEVGGKMGVADLESQGLAALVVEAAEENLEISALPSQEISQETFREQEDKGIFNRPSFSLPAVSGRLLHLLGRWKSYFPRSGRGRLMVAVVLIIVIALGAGYKYKSDRDRQIQLQFNQLLQQAKDDFNGAKGLSSLSPTEAKNKLDLAKDKLNKALSLKSKDQEALSFKAQLEGETGSILQQISVSNFPVFLDMDLVKKNFRATQLSLSGGKLLLLDPGVKTLVVVDLAKKSNQVLAGSEQLGEATFASLNGGIAFIYSKDKGVLRIDTTNSKLSVVAKKDDEWGQVADLYAFAGNVYLLDAGKNQIWKYLPAANTYSDKREYLSKDTKVDFSGASRMQIESSVYLLKSGGEILRYTRGDKDNFSIGGLDKGVKNPKSIFISSDTDNLYLLDSGNSRLLILTKTGGYKGQITGDKFATATDLAVDEAGKKVYLLDGSKIYSVELK